MEGIHLIIADFDDFCDDERSAADLERLIQLKQKVPALKVTLFTIPGRCSPEFIARVRSEYSWLDLVQHGWNHDTNYECMKWTKADCRDFLAAGRDIGLTTKGFKSPGWQISDGCYEALAEEGYWVADQAYNDGRRPAKLRAYKLNSTFAAVAKVIEKPVSWNDPPSPWKQFITTSVDAWIHGHIGHLGGRNENALELLMPMLMESTETSWQFIDEVMR